MHRFPPGDNPTVSELAITDERGAVDRRGRPGRLPADRAGQVTADGRVDDRDRAGHRHRRVGSSADLDGLPDALLAAPPARADPGVDHPRRSDRGEAQVARIAEDSGHVDDHVGRRVGEDAERAVGGDRDEDRAGNGFTGLPVDIGHHRDRARTRKAARKPALLPSVTVSVAATAAAPGGAWMACCDARPVLRVSSLRSGVIGLNSSPPVGTNTPWRSTTTSVAALLKTHSVRPGPSKVVACAAACLAGQEVDARGQRLLRSARPHREVAGCGGSGSGHVDGHRRGIRADRRRGEHRQIDRQRSTGGDPSAGVARVDQAHRIHRTVGVRIAAGRRGDLGADVSRHTQPSRDVVGDQCAAGAVLGWPGQMCVVGRDLDAAGDQDRRPVPQREVRAARRRRSAGPGSRRPACRAAPWSATPTTPRGRRRRRP